MRPVFEKNRPTQNDRTHERDEISRRQERAERIKNPRHGFPREDEAGKKNAGQHVSHGYLQGLHLVLGFRADKQTKAEQGKHVNQRGKHHREYAAVDRHIKEKSKIDMMIKMTRCGQYSKKIAPRKMIARMSEMK